MGVRVFVALVPEVVRPQLPEGLRWFESRTRPSLVQLHFGDPRIHYELWIQRRVERLEIGLHFEGAREDNLRHLAELAARFDGIVPALGPGPAGRVPELDEWTASWTRVHETWPLEPLTASLLDRAAQRLAAYIATLQPLLAPGPL